MTDTPTPWAPPAPQHTTNPLYKRVPADVVDLFKWLSLPLDEQEQAEWNAYFADVPAHVMEQVHEDAIRSQQSYFKGSGLFPSLMSLKGTRTHGDPLGFRVPKDLQPYYRRATAHPYAKIVVTNGEHWWPGPRWFTSTTDAEGFLEALYEAVTRTGDMGLLKYYPREKRGAGRPADPMVAERKERERAAASAFLVWVEACRQRKGRIEEAKRAYKDALAEIEVLRLAWKEAEAEPVPQRPS